MEPAQWRVKNQHRKNPPFERSLYLLEQKYSRESIQLQVKETFS